MSLKIDCLSLYQPWSELVVAGIKPIENRDHSRFNNHRGPLLIHAAKKFDADWGCSDPQCQKAAIAHLKSVCSYPTKLPRGCIVGCVIHDGYLGPKEEITGWHESGCYGLKFLHAIKFSQPIPYVGHQGMFKADIHGKLPAADLIKLMFQIMKWRG